MPLTPDQMREAQHYQQVARKHGIGWLRFLPQKDVRPPTDRIKNPQLPASRDDPTGWVHIIDPVTDNIHTFISSCNQVERLGCMECRAQALDKSIGRSFR